MDQSQITINKHKIYFDGTEAIYSSEIILKDKTFTLWFKTSKDYAKCLSDTEDPALLAILFTAMREKCDITVKGKISKGLLENLDHFQDAWACWMPQRYSKVQITARSFVNISHPKESTILGFSGGLDCVYSLWKNTKSNHKYKHKIDACMFVHGFDIPLKNETEYNQAFLKSSKITEQVKVPLIRITTNIRYLKEDWEDVHGAALAACMNLLNKKFDTGMIASGEAYHKIHLPWGSNQVSDHLMNSNNFKLIDDGSEYQRIEKAKALLEWPEGLKYVRVCWRGENDKNCCKCEKCIRNILSFKSYGAKVPECFEHEVTNKDIIRLTLNNTCQMGGMEQILENARKNNIKEPWVKAVEACIRKNKRIHRLKDLNIYYIVPKKIRKMIGKIYG